MKKLENIIIHISDSDFGSAWLIRKWHQEKGWKDIGYHFVILNGRLTADFDLPCLCGSIETGRPLDGDSFIEDFEIGAHALGYNDKSIGICAIGKTWHPKQVASAVVLVSHLCRKFNLNPDQVLGHYEVTHGKTCPNMDMNIFREEVKKWIILKKN